MSNDVPNSPLEVFRRHIGRFHIARSLYSFYRASGRALRDSRGDAAASLDDWYRSDRDPWDYATHPEERRRYETALELIDDLGRDWPRALEVGCGEGLFTSKLAARCGSVLAVDVSGVALARAREHCSRFEHVRFAEWDARVDPPFGRFDLVVCMDVICDIHRPLAQRRALAKVAGSVATGGRLVVSAVIQDALIEDAYWASWLGRGGRWVIDRFAAQDHLVHQETRQTDRHLLALFAAAT